MKKLTIKKSPEILDLIKQLGSKDPIKSTAAQVSLAQHIGPVLQEVINVAPTLSNRWTTFEFNEMDSPSIPVDPYAGIDETDYLRVWSQPHAGGMPFNQPVPIQSELKFTTYRLDSAITWDRKYARQARLDIVARGFNRLAQEVLLKQERNSAALLLMALAQNEVTLKGSGATVRQILRTTRPREFILHDYVRLFTLLKRIHTAWNGGTPDPQQGRGLTDIMVSPEIVQMLREMAYNPINTRAGVISGDGTTGTATTAITLPASVRQEVYANAGIPEFYGVNIIEMNELGIGQVYNELFAAMAGSTLYADNGNKVAGDMAGARPFDKTKEEIMVGVDFSNTESLMRAVAVDADTGSQFTLQPDNQFVDRSGKIGWYGALEEGRVILDAKVLVGFIC